MSRLVSAQTDRNDVLVEASTITHGPPRKVRVDYLVCATGFKVRSPVELMSSETAYQVKRHPDNYPILRRDYSLEFSNAPDLLLFAPSLAERSHGLTATLISNMAARAGELVERILQAEHPYQS